MKIYKLADISNVVEIGPLYHGTPHSFENIKFRNHVLFLSETIDFAYDYARQKSQEGQMDADCNVYSLNISGKVFDPKNEQDLEYFASHMPNDVKCMSYMYQQATFSKEQWKAYMRGEIMDRAKFSEEDLVGKVVGDKLPDNDVYGGPLSYILLDIDSNKVQYCETYTIYDLASGSKANWVGRRDGNFPIDLQTVIKDYSEHYNDDMFWIRPPYFATEFRGSKKIYTARRGDKMTYGNDNWEFFEGSDCLDIAREIGYDICKLQENNQVTYAVFDTAKLSNLQKVNI